MFLRAPTQVSLLAARSSMSSSSRHGTSQPQCLDLSRPPDDWLHLYSKHVTGGYLSTEETTSHIPMQGVPVPMMSRGGNYVGQRKKRACPYHPCPGLSAITFSVLWVVKYDSVRQPAKARTGVQHLLTTPEPTPKQKDAAQDKTRDDSEEALGNPLGDRCWGRGQPQVTLGTRACRICSELVEELKASGLLWRGNLEVLGLCWENEAS